MQKEKITQKDVQDLIKGKLSRYFGCSPREATKEQMYKAAAMTIRDILTEKERSTSVR